MESRLSEHLSNKQNCCHHAESKGPGRSWSDCCLHYCHCWTVILLLNLPSIILNFTSWSIFALDAELFLPAANNVLLGFDDTSLWLDDDVLTLVDEGASLLLQHAGSDWTTFCLVRIGEEGSPAGGGWHQRWAVLAIDGFVCWCWRHILAWESNGTVHDLMNLPVIFLGFASS